jgi:hypothetical protein
MHYHLTTIRALISLSLLPLLLGACTSGASFNSTPTMSLPPVPTHLPTQTPAPFPAAKLLWNLAISENETGTWCDSMPVYARGYNWARQMIIDTAQQYQLPDWNATGQFGVEYQVGGSALGLPANVYVTTNPDGTLCIDVNSPLPAGDYPVEIVFTISTSSPPDFPQIPPDSRILLLKVMPPVDLSRTADDLLLVSADGILIVDATRMEMTRLATGSYPLGPAWSPDGSRVTWFEGAGEVIVINADGSGLREIAPGAFDPDWSPDGKQIAFTGYAGVQVRNSTFGSIQIAQPDGSGAVSIAQGSNPQWSPGANEIAYLLNDGLWLVGVEGGAPRLLAGDISVPVRTPGQDASREFSWSPDGSRIAYITRSQNGGVGFLSLAARDGSTPVHLVDLAQSIASINGAAIPVWSPDGNTIALICDGLCLAGMDGSLRRVPQEMWISSLTWSRDGTKVYMSVAENEFSGILVYDMAGGTISPVLVSNFRGIRGLEAR